MRRCARMGTSNRRMPSFVVELLRLCVVVFFAAVGYKVGTLAFPGGGAILGALSGPAVAVVVGTGSGYVLGGALGRRTVDAVSRTEHALRDHSAEQVVAAGFGSIVGVMVGCGIAWPALVVGHHALTVPVFAFVVMTTGLLGSRIGVAKRESMLGLFGPRAGMAPRSPEISSLPRLIDTSVAIDGRILDVVRAGFLGGRFLVAAPVIAELQGLADASDDLRRGRGRRGLEVLESLRHLRGVDLEAIDDEALEVPEVDAKLVRICLDRGCALLTIDTNLAKAAALAGVRTLNLHALAMALRPAVTAGDEVSVLLMKPGKEPGQAVGYLDDGTMVVVERAREFVGSEAHVLVTSVLTTANGRLVFARVLPGMTGAHPPLEAVDARALPHPRR